MEKVLGIDRRFKTRRRVQRILTGSFCPYRRQKLQHSSLKSVDMNGPDLPFVTPSSAATQLPQSRHSLMALHLLYRNDCKADVAEVRASCFSTFSLWIGLLRWSHHRDDLWVTANIYRVVRFESKPLIKRDVLWLC